METQLDLGKHVSLPLLVGLGATDGDKVDGIIPQLCPPPFRPDVGHLFSDLWWEELHVPIEQGIISWVT